MLQMRAGERPLCAVGAVAQAGTRPMSAHNGLSPARISSNWHHSFWSYQVHVYVSRTKPSHLCVTSQTFEHTLPTHRELSWAPREACDRDLGLTPFHRS